jgi:hypothetical protein
MAKNSTRRHHAKRIQDKWIRLSKHFDFIPENSLSFGKIFHQDPLDCGVPNCSVCSGHKQNKTRQKTRLLEKNYERSSTGDFTEN